MRTTRIPLLLFALLVCGLGQPLRAQLEFTDDTTGLGGEDFLSLAYFVEEGVPIGDIYREWGIQIRSPASPVVLRRIQCEISYPEPMPCFIDLFSNDTGTTEDPAHQNRPLVIQFQNPAQRVQFVLANGTEGLDVAIRAYDFTGRELGELNYPYSIRSSREQFTDSIRVGTSSPNGIATLVIDYGESDRAEQLGWLRVAFVESPVFETYLPQIAAGQLPSGEVLSTAITIFGVANTATHGSVEFYDPDGDPLPLRFESIDLGPMSTVPFELGNPLHLAPRSEAGELIIGSALIRTWGAPVLASATFSVTANERVVSEAGIATVSPGWNVRGHARYRPAAGGSAEGENGNRPEINTGIAVLNPSDRDVFVQIWAHSSSGGGRSPDLTIPARSRVALFVDELFQTLRDREFDGEVSIYADGPVAVTFLETQDGLVTSSLPGQALPEAGAFH